MDRSTIGEAPSRLAWPDSAKAISIALVVLLHASAYTSRVRWASSEWDIPALWPQISLALAPIRMPLFFVVSGYLLSSSISSAPLMSFASKRLSGPAYLYSVWFIIHMAFHFAVPNTYATHRPSSYSEVLPSFLLGTTTLWYLYALAVYAAVAWICRPFPRSSVAAAAVLSVSAPYYKGLVDGNTGSVLQGLIFFLFAALFPTIIDRWVHAMSARRAVVWLSAYGASALFVFFAEAQSLVAVRLLLSAIGVRALLSCCSVIPAGAGLSVVGRWLGSRTLPLYVLNIPILVAWSLTLGPMIESHSGLMGSHFWYFAYPLLLTVIVSVTALLLHAVSVRHLPWLWRRHTRS